MKRLRFSAEDTSEGHLLLVNPLHPLSSDIPSSRLVPIRGDAPRVLLERQAARMLCQVMTALGCGREIVPVSGYRTMQEQQAIYSDSLREHGEDFTSKYVAFPGGSEHQTGLAIDLGELREDIDFLRPSFPYTGICGRFRDLSVRLGVHAFAVATIDEGIRLREEGITGEILILGYTPAVRAPELARYRLSQTVVDVEHAQELNSSVRPIRVHIKVDTGMRRLGEDYRHVSEIADIFGCRNLEVEGIFTHLSVSDSIAGIDASFTDRQIRRFYELLDELKRKGIPIPKVHIQSSYGILNCPELQCDYARVGLALYGVLSRPDEDTRRSLDLRPVLALRSRVALVRTIECGEGVGYGRSFVARHEIRIAVVTIGYADGVPRSLSNGKGYVLVGGRRAPIIGQICMDQLTVDVTGIPGVGRGSVVTLIGCDGAEEIKAEQMAADAGTITNELLSRLGSRLERVIC